MSLVPADLPRLMTEEPIKGAVLLGGGGRSDKRHIWRMALWRQWDSRLPLLSIVMLNPSTADAREDDYTIVRLIDFAIRGGYGSFLVTNLFAYRATDPLDLLLRGFDRCIGPQNDDWIRAACTGRDVLAAWGAVGQCGGRPDKVWRIIKPVAARVLSLGTNKDGSPPHPSRLSKSVKMQPWSPAKEADADV